MKMPNICLPNNFLGFNDRRKTDTGTPVTVTLAESLPTGLIFIWILRVINLFTKYIILFYLGSDELKRQIIDLRRQNDRLNRQNQEFTGKVETLESKIKSLESENQILISINEAFSQENNKLTAEIKRYQSFRVPRSIQSAQST